MTRPATAATPAADGVGHSFVAPATDPASHRCWFDNATFVEPTLRELLDDPLTLLLMRSDRVKPADIAALFDAINVLKT